MPRVNRQSGIELEDELPIVRGLLAFDSFYRDEFPRLVDLVYALSGSRLAAEDLVQEAMVAAHQSWEQVGRLDRPGAWVRRVVINRSTSFYRRRLAEMRALARLAPLLGQIPGSLPPEAEIFWKQLRHLARRQAQALALHYLEDLDISEVAIVMDCSESTVRVHLHRGRHNLARRLGRFPHPQDSAEEPL